MASLRAISRPIPAVEPVTRAVLSLVAAPLRGFPYRVTTNHSLEAPVEVRLGCFQRPHKVRCPEQRAFFRLLGRGKPVTFGELRLMTGAPARFANKAPAISSFRAVFSVSLGRRSRVAAR